jgi:hypothetical protein
MIANSLIVPSRSTELVRDLHTTLATGADHGELLELAVYLHVHVTQTWLILAAAPAALLRRVVFLARRLAQERGEVTTLGVAGFGVAETLLTGGVFELGQVELDSLTLPPTTVATAGLVGTLTAVHSRAAALNGRPDEAAAAMDAAADMANRFGELGETDPLGFEFGPTFVGFRRVRLALDAGEPDRAVSIAEGLHPEHNPFPTNRASHWVGYGRALAQLRGRRDDAVRALRRAETMNPVRVRRNPLSVTCLLCCSGPRAGVHRRIRSYGTWPAGPVCPCSPQPNGDVSPERQIRPRFLRGVSSKRQPAVIVGPWSSSWSMYLRQSSTGPAGAGGWWC